MNHYRSSQHYYFIPFWIIKYLIEYVIFCTCFLSKTSLRNCLTELKEQADSDGGFIGRTFEQLRDLYAEEYPQFFQQEDLDFEAPIKGQGLTEEDEKSRRLQALKDFLSGRIETIVWDYKKSLRKKLLLFTQ